MPPCDDSQAANVHSEEPDAGNLLVRVCGLTITHKYSVPTFKNFYIDLQDLLDCFLYRYVIRQKAAHLWKLSLWNVDRLCLLRLIFISQAPGAAA